MRQPQQFVHKLTWLGFTAALLFFGFTSSVQAHAGGEPQIINGEAGECLISVWSLPNPLVSGDVNFIAAVAKEQEINGYQEAVAVLDAKIEFVLTSNSGETIRAIASQENAVNKLFYETYFVLPSAGAWDVTANVTCGESAGSAQFTAEAAQPPLNINWTLIGGIAIGILGLGWFIWQSRGTPENEPTPAETSETAT